jgi:hypothetical protein
MKERPIMFSGPSIPMVMAGTKTQTRRIADLERLSVDLPADVRSDLWDVMPAGERRIAKKGRHRAKIGDAGAVFAVCPDGDRFGLKPGEFNLRSPLVDGTSHLADHGNGKKIWTVTPVGEQRLWVRETWRLYESAKHNPWPDLPSRHGPDGLAFYRDGFDRSPPTRWRPSIFMPRWASRTNLTPIQARLMRLQDITDDEAIAEGVTFTDYGMGEFQQRLPGWHYGPSTRHDDCLDRPRIAFGNYWNVLHAGPRWNRDPGPSPWDLNPWVWAYTFRKEA